MGGFYIYGPDISLISFPGWIIDVKGYKKWTFFRVVIGMNSITIWVLQRLIDFQFTTDAIFQGLAQYLGAWEPVFITFCVLLVKWLFLLFLYRRNIFLKA
jgi:predicted acyltransferase